jgi:uncharacterized protein (DUF433 family)
MFGQGNADRAASAQVLGFAGIGLGGMAAKGRASSRHPAERRRRVEPSADFVAEVRRELAPAGIVETLLVDLIARSAWRLASGEGRRPSTLRAAERGLLRGLSALEGLRGRPTSAWGVAPPRPGTPSHGPAPEVGPSIDPARLARCAPYHVEGLGWDLDLESGEPSDRDEADSTHGGRWRRRLIFDPAVSETSPVVKGTWISVAQIISLIVDGWTWADILRSHPELTEDDIRACLSYAVEQEDGPLAFGTTEAP